MIGLRIYSFFYGYWYQYRTQESEVKCENHFQISGQLEVAVNAVELGGAEATYNISYNKLRDRVKSG